MNLMDAVATEGAVTLPSGQSVPYAGPHRGKLTLGVRPEHLVEGDGPFVVEVAMLEQLGAATLLHGELNGSAIVASLPGLQSREIGAKISFAAQEGALHFFDENGSRID